jgi:hypothetical protein
MDVLQITQMKALDLQPNPFNSNVITPENEVKLKESIERLGMFKPILVRTLQDGTKQILGGEHRWRAAVEMGYETVPILDLGGLDDVKAKQISLIDNGRYGVDDNFKLAELLSGVGDIEEFSTFAPFEPDDIKDIFSSKSINIDDLGIDDLSLEQPEKPRSDTLQKSVVMRFKVPLEDAGVVEDLINAVKKEQGFTEGDSLQNAGDALVYLCSNYEKEEESATG